MSYTIDHLCQAEIEIKKSRFIALLKPTASVEEAKTWLVELNKQYRDADHVCYAYRISKPALREKAFDAGEPKGTASRPILSQLQRHDLIDCCLAVVRYFGGIKLGAGGLTRAYGQAAGKVVERAEKKEPIEWLIRQFELDYADFARLQRRLPSLGVEVVEVNFGKQVLVSLKLPKEVLNTLKSQLRNG